MISDPWLVHPKAQPDELLSSWLIRIAARQGRKLHNFCHSNWPGLQIWTRDIDSSAPETLLSRLSEKTYTPSNNVNKTCLKTHEGVLYPTLTVRGITPHLTPIGVYHRERKGFGLRYCSACLNEDDHPYFRVIWRLSAFPCCTKHGLQLVDACPQCDSPIAPHRGLMTICHRCDSDIRSANQTIANSSVLQFQHHNQRVLAGSPVTRPGLLGLHPLSYFALVGRLAYLCTSGPRRDRLLEAVRQINPEIQQPEFHGKVNALRFLTVQSWHSVLMAVEILLRGWPWMFVGLCQDAGLYWSWIQQDIRRDFLPMAIEEPAKLFLKDQYALSGSAAMREP